MRTDQEIIDRINARKEADFFGFELTDLLIRLLFELAKPFLNPDVKDEDWKVQPRDRDSVLKEMLEYMPFAWDKANNCRGLSAGRSMCHYMAWVWLAGDDLGDLTDYQYYGKDNLVKICDHYGWDSSQWDDGAVTRF
jgi:hypothetical protein